MAPYSCAMADTPWLGDSVSLVDAFRAGERSPVEELEAYEAGLLQAAKASLDLQEQVVSRGVKPTGAKR